MKDIILYKDKKYYSVPNIGEVIYTVQEIMGKHRFIQETVKSISIESDGIWIVTNFQSRPIWANEPSPLYFKSKRNAIGYCESMNQENKNNEMVN